MNEKIVRIIARIRMEYCELLMKYCMIDRRMSHVAMFHDLVQDNESVDDEFTVNVNELLDYINRCRSAGMQFVSLDKLLSLESSEACDGKCAITFDDGFVSVYRLAAPILTSQKIPFALFITSSFLDNEKYITTEMLSELANNPYCTIGMHCHEHVMWRYQSDLELQEDFIKCRQRLYEITGLERFHFAFPYGSYYAVSKRNVKVIKEMGVKSIFLTDQRKLMSKDIKHPCNGIPRLNIPKYYKGR